MSGRDEFNEDNDFSSPMMAAAVGMHELYVTLQEAGFSRRDSLDLIAKIMYGSMSEIAQSTEEDE
jgi:hypothetical protein